LVSLIPTQPTVLKCRNLIGHCFDAFDDVIDSVGDIRVCNHCGLKQKLEWVNAH